MNWKRGIAEGPVVFTPDEEVPKKSRRKKK